MQAANTRLMSLRLSIWNIAWLLFSSFIEQWAQNGMLLFESEMSPTDTFYE